MNKTKREWLQELPEPYCSQAIINSSNLDCIGYSSIVDVLDNAFIWEKSPEGDVYWKKIRNDLALLNNKENDKDNI